MNTLKTKEIEKKVLIIQKEWANSIISIGKAFLNKQKFKILFNYSRRKKIKCFASIFSETELKDYLSVTKDFIKIPSHEAYNLDLIKKCIKKFKFVFISCGCLTYKELKKITKLTKFKNVILMHCVSSYPLTPKNCNFKKFDYLDYMDRIGCKYHRYNYKCLLNLRAFA